MVSFSVDEFHIFKHSSQVDLIRRTAYSLFPRNDSAVEMLINQRRGKTRQIVNLDELCDVISSSTSISPVVIDFENYFFSSQVHWMKSARIFMTTHGAGSTNIIFLRPGSIVIEFLPPQFSPPFYRTLSLQAGVSYYPFHNTTIVNNGCGGGWHPLLNCNLNISANLLIVLLKRLM